MLDENKLGRPIGIEVSEPTNIYFIHILAQ